MLGTLQKPDNITSYVSNGELYGLVGHYVSVYKALNGISDVDVAREVGCTRQAIQALRKGKGAYTSSRFIARVAAAFGLTLVQMLDEARKLPAPAPAQSKQ